MCIVADLDLTWNSSRNTLWFAGLSVLMVPTFAANSVVVLTSIGDLNTSFNARNIVMYCSWKKNNRYFWYMFICDSHCLTFKILFRVLSLTFILKRQDSYAINVFLGCSKYKKRNSSVQWLIDKSFITHVIVSLQLEPLNSSRLLYPFFWYTVQLYYQNCLTLIKCSYYW
jgi:hypothetical protein